MNSFMDLDTGVRRQVYELLAGREQAQLLQTAAMASGNLHSRDEATQLALRSSVRVVVVERLIGAVMFDAGMCKRRTFGDIQRRIRSRYHIRRVNMRLLRQLTEENLEECHPLTEIGNVGLGSESDARPCLTLSLQRVFATCNVCGSLSRVNYCSGCEIAMYCSLRCQSIDWPLHRSECNA